MVVCFLSRLVEHRTLQGPGVEEVQIEANLVPFFLCSWGMLSTITRSIWVLWNRDVCFGMEALPCAVIPNHSLCVTCKLVNKFICY